MEQGRDRSAGMIRQLDRGEAVATPSGPGETATWIARPLPLIPTDAATELIERLYGPEQRMARAFYRYWRDVRHLPEPEANERTRAELAESTEQLLADLDDQAVITIGRRIDGAFIPCGLFGLRDLATHSYGRKIQAQLQANRSLRMRFVGRLGIGHSLAILDEAANLEVFGFAVSTMGHQAQARGYNCVFFFSSDHRLESIYRRLGFEFPTDLVPDGDAHLVGVWDLSHPENRDRLRRAKARFGIPVVQGS